MGIDVYLCWDGQTEEEKEAQITGYSMTHGHVGYLRGAYSKRGISDIICALFPEGRHKVYDEEKERAGFRLDVKKLRQDLETVKKIYKDDDRMLDVHWKSFEDFVALAEKKEEEGKNPRVIMSG